MRICVVGSSPRENALAALCRERGHETPSIGPWDQVALPLPVSNMPEELESYLPRGQKIICGKTNAHLEAMAARRGWNLRNVLLDEAFQLENASLTAEGALWAAMSRSDAALHGSRFRCVITDANGSVTSDAATMYIGLETIKNPTNTFIIKRRNSK